MFQIVEKKKLNDAVVMVRIAAPLIAKKVLPGQFIIFRLDEFGERVPLTVADYDREGGTITLIFQIAGETTRQFSLLEAGDSILDLVGPLGVPTELPEGTKSVCVIGGGVGNLIDRVRLGYVVDMLDCTFIEFPVFNVADCFITVGCFALIVYVIFLDRTEDKKRENTPSES